MSLSLRSSPVSLFPKTRSQSDFSQCTPIIPFLSNPQSNIPFFSSIRSDPKFCFSKSYFDYPKKTLSKFWVKPFNPTFSPEDPIFRKTPKLDSIRIPKTNNFQKLRNFRQKFSSVRCNISSSDNSDIGVPKKNVWEILTEPIDPQIPLNPDPSLINEDFKPTLSEERFFSIWDLTSLWIGLVVAIPTWYLAGSLVDLGMSWVEGILTILLANSLLLLPMVLNGHPGCKYGLPFPILSRSSFGIRGAHLPSLLRALVACGWFGIQTWVGGQAIYRMVETLMGGGGVGGGVGREVVKWLGISWAEFGCFLAFWGVQVGVVWNGMESIRDLEAWSAPILIAMCAALLFWAYKEAGSFGEMLSTPSQFRIGGPKEGKFWGTFFPALTANVGFWATLSLNIPDFTRYAKSQKDQLIGQALGLPLFMAAFTFVGLAVTSATVVIFGRVISDPIEVLGQIKGTVPIVLSIIGLVLATLSTNIAANVVAPANALINLNPKIFNFRRAGLLTAVCGILLAPWRLIQSTQGFIFTWLIGYSALLGPVAGIVITDYFFIRKRVLDIDALYSSETSGAYWYSNGYNLSAIFAMVLGILPNVPGFLQVAGIVATVPPLWITVYGNAWIVGFVVSALVYALLMSRQKKTVSAVLKEDLGLS